jgi:RsiW-degrading membrane proteinase PrsW (M82 family)
MLQRIQSIYLLFAALVIFALFLFPVAHNIYIDGVASTIKVTGIYHDVNGQQQQTTPFTTLSIVTAIVGLVPLVVIFMYKNRKQQITMCYVAMLVIIGYSFWLSQVVKTATDGFEMKTSNFGIGILLSSLSIVLLIFAAKSIGRDEKLVRSADRLR